MRTQIIGNARAPALLNPLPQALALLNGMTFMGKPSARNRGYGNENQEQAQAELKFHRRIIP
jgi:hypothetical protein